MIQAKSPLGTIYRALVERSGKLPIACLAAILVVYFPVAKAGFVWDDITDFSQMGWLYHGDDWKIYIFQGFHNWTKYFRPLGVLGFVAQVRTFGGTPAPMHVVSLVMHLANAALIMRAAWLLAPATKRRLLLACASGLIYGLHPMLVEIVTWIGCQFDELQVMTGSLALIASLSIHNRIRRAVVVGTLFFLSFCAKESAIALPVVLGLIHFFHDQDRTESLRRRLARLLGQQWVSCLGLALGGLVYWLLRRHFMGGTLPSLGETVSQLDWNQWERIALTYLHYWQVISGVATQLSPIHPLDSYTFGTSPWLWGVRCACALLIASSAVLLLGRHLPATGTAVAAATVSLIPVLGLLPFNFDDSLYHERYAVGAIAWLAILIPRIAAEWIRLLGSARYVKAISAALLACWLVIGALNIRVTIPLWSNNLLLWEWAMKHYPEDEFALSNVISAYAAYGLDQDALDLADKATLKKINCTLCYVTSAMISLKANHLAAADAYLGQAHRSLDADPDLKDLPVFYRTAGNLELRNGNYKTAMALLEGAQNMQPADPLTYLMLAEVSWRTGKFEKADHEMAQAAKIASPSMLGEVQRITARIKELPR